MESIIITSPAEIEQIVRKAIKDYLIPHPIPPKDNLTLSEAVGFLKELGYPTGKSTVYKLTSANKIPYKKYGNKLMFSRKELDAWVENQVIHMSDTSSATQSLADSVRNKKMR